MKLTKENMIKITLIIFASITFYVALSHFSVVLNILGKIIAIITPFLVGIALAFVLNLPLRLFENHIFPKLFPTSKKWAKKIKRPLGIIFSMLVILIIITIFMLLIIPEIQNTIVTFVENLPSQVQQITDTINNLIEKYNIPFQPFELVNIDWEKISSSLLEEFTSGGTVVIDTTIDFITMIIGTITNLVVGFVFSIYLLASKETLQRQSHRLIQAILSEKAYAKIHHVFSLSDDVFSSFVLGQATEALILGILTYIGMLILGLPYAVMISSLIAITALIPVVGPLIGIGIGALMILLSSPIQAVWFVVFIMILQQFEGNVIYPKVVGSSVGLPSIWVLVSVVIGGNLYGVLGILLSVPLSAITYVLLKEFINKKLNDQESA